MPNNKTVFDIEYAGPETPQSQQRMEDSKMESNNQENNMCLPILVIAIIIIVIVIGGIFLYKKCVAEEPMASGKDKNQNPNHNQSISSSRNIQNLEDIEIKSPNHWNAITSSNDPVFSVACTMTGCGPCNQFKPALLAAAKKSKQPIYMLNYNGEEWKQNELSNMKVSGFPSMYRFTKDQAPQEYKGDRTEGSVLRFIETGSG